MADLAVNGRMTTTTWAMARLSARRSDRRLVFIRDKDRTSEGEEFLPWVNEATTILGSGGWVRIYHGDDSVLIYRSQGRSQSQSQMVPRDSPKGEMTEACSFGHRHLWTTLHPIPYHVTQNHSWSQGEKSAALGGEKCHCRK